MTALTIATPRQTAEQIFLAGVNEAIVAMMSPGYRALALIRKHGLTYAQDAKGIVTVKDRAGKRVAFGKTVEKVCEALENRYFFN